MAEPCRNYSDRVPALPGPEPVAPVLDALARLRDHVARTEDDVLAGLAVLGEAGDQRILDSWLDQVADTLRAVGGECSAQSDALGRLAARAGRAGVSGDRAAGRTGSGGAT